MSNNLVDVKRQVYLVDGKEVVLDDVTVKVTETDEGKIREVSYLARHVRLDGSKYAVGPSFHTDKIQWIGRVIKLQEAA